MAWDKTIPADADKLKTSAGDIRDNWSYIETTLDIKHDFSGGTGVHTLFGSWTSKSFDTNYQATSDGFVVASINCVADGERGYIVGVSDSASPPTTIRAKASAHYDSTVGVYIQYNSICFPVKKNDYYKVTSNTGSGTPDYVSMFFIAME